MMVDKNIQFLPASEPADPEQEKPVWNWSRAEGEILCERAQRQARSEDSQPLKDPRQVGQA